jgi:3D (Asp-Asp-Asp) domain-containing protein
MATDYTNTIPRAVADDLLIAITVESVALRLGTVIRMPEGLESLPVVSALPTAGFTNPRFGGRKLATSIEWSAQQLVPEEIAAALAIPSAFVDDAGFPVWEQVRPMLSTAIAKVIDNAVLFGNGEPTTYPPNGVSGAVAPAVSADALTAIDSGLAALEAQGLVGNGIASSPVIGTALRQEYRSIAVTPDVAPAQTLYGIPVMTTPVWDETKGDAIVGDWTKLVIGMRQDLRFETSTDAILQDGTGAIIANAFQDDLVAMRCYLRMGVAIGAPLHPETGTATDPFVNVDWTA